MTRYGVPDDELLSLPTVFRDGILDGRVALISGAGTGIGKATACLFARLGAKLVLCGRQEEKLAVTAALIERAGSVAQIVPTNIRDSDHVEALFAAVVERFGHLDVLVNNAGGQFPKESIDLSPRGWNAVIDTNLNGTWAMTQRAAQCFRDAKRAGVIINIVVPQRGMYGVAHTVAARAAVESLTKNLSVEWAQYDIRLNCVSPGPINTEGMNVYPPEAQAAMRSSNPLFAFGDVQDVAEACVYLSAASGKFVTGEVLVVDGGLQNWGELWLAGKPAYHRDGPQ